MPRSRVCRWTQFMGSGLGFKFSVERLGFEVQGFGWSFSIQGQGFRV